ncbi:MAG: Holliday junction branch migration protein RuvA [Ruminococcaceae bacterium]|nr:Holliday junction branch migration protein RuvA [Oscillospiraceae bacterium]
MFYYLSGKLTVLESSIAVIDVGGMGYKLTVSGTTHDSLPSPRLSPDDAPSVKLFTHLAVREDDIELFGFYSAEELSAFKMLISVSGVGPKAAMAILTLLTPEKFALAVCSEDTKTLSKASGVGAKTAARIVLELKDKLSKESATAISSGVTSFADVSPIPKNRLSEAQDALVVLGYSRSEAVSVLKNIDANGLELEEIIKLALKKLMR